MSIIDWLFDKLSSNIAKRINTDEGRALIPLRAYRIGEQPPQLRIKPNQYDDNIIINFCRLVIDRAVSQLIGKGVEFDFEGDTETENEVYVNSFWDANKQEITLHRLCLSAAETGTGYIALSEGAVYANDGQAYPRAVVKDPTLMTMDSLPHDWEVVIRYTNEYKYIGTDGKEHAHRRVYERDMGSEVEKWEIKDYEQDNGGKWEETESYVWDYPFSPVLHFQNLPSIDSPYGTPEITPDTMALQDRINFLSSNLSKLVRLYAHSTRYGWGSTSQTIKLGPDDMVWFPDKDSGMAQLVPGADMPGAMAFLLTMKQAFFGITRSVDIDSIGDKLGALTNFGLRVLYQDNTAKIETKRELLGDFLSEINRRVQLMKPMQPIESDVVWEDFLPSNPAEEAQLQQMYLNMGIVDKQTISKEAGYDWEQVQERLSKQQTNDDNIGAKLLRDFSRGGGGINLPRQQEE